MSYCVKTGYIKKELVTKEQAAKELVQKNRVKVRVRVRLTLTLSK